ncbi:MAG: glucokinase [Cereibacter sphaeroides]|uniref:Glucokinase n=1 Tax=Cereibacter sphaeroides TaxID=1063 RepID=A0A2W5SF40_CERSP|nr:MAG: glucokinase [Cereibacter sphaeroides]
MPDAPLCLVADIGGTNTRVALTDGTVIRPDSVRRFRNEEFPGLESVLAKYVAEAGVTGIVGACIAAAGPVKDQVATLTNRDWTIDHGTLIRPTGAKKVAILNDLQAPGYALGHISPEKLRPLIDGPQVPGGAMLVVNVGTGFNAAPVHDTEWGRIVTASECGHVNMPIRTEADLRLAHYVETAHGFPGVEDVLSGRGLERLWGFVTTEAGRPSERSSAQIMAAIDEGKDQDAKDTARLFTRLLGADCGNLALIHLPFGGIYLVGGIARAFTEHLGPLGFTEAFRDKGRFAGFMQNFAVTILEDDYAPLTGCAAHLAQVLRA